MLTLGNVTLFVSLIRRPGSVNIPDERPTLQMCRLSTINVFIEESDQLELHSVDLIKGRLCAFN